MAKTKGKAVGKVTTPSKEPTPKHSQKEKSAIAASLKMSKPQYENSVHHGVMPYEAARSFTKNPTPKEEKPTQQLKITHAVAKDLAHDAKKGWLDQDESFMKDIVEATNINEFHTVFNAHYKGKKIMHRGFGLVVEPQSVQPSVLDQKQNALKYKVGDTTGGVQLKRFFEFFEIVD